MKRMWVKPGSQKTGVGTELLTAALQLASDCGYTSIRLDTLHTMLPAISLYRKHGFYEIPAYYHNPDPRALYLEKIL